MTTRSKAKKAPALTTLADAATHVSPATAHATPAPAAPAPVLFIAPPPPTANIPSVPSGFQPTTGANYRGSQPHTAELVALPLAIKDLLNFVSYDAVIGGTAPPMAEVRQMFEVANQWSTMRNASSAWDAYSRDQEGIAWTAMRPVMQRLKAAFVLAATTNPSLGTTFAGITALLGAKTVSAHRAVATKKKNKLDVAQGKAPTHGQVGKSRQKAAAKAALSALEAKPVGPSSGLGVAPTTPMTAPAPTPTAHGPVAQATQPTEATAPPATGGAPIGSNGAAHS